MTHGDRPRHTGTDPLCEDFMTTANFWFDENSLKQALLTVPDLRHSSLTLGLSVDMSWSTGINFNDITLGGQ